MSIKGFVINGTTVKYNYPDLDNKPDNLVVDDTLSIVGAAADAKKVGDEIDAIKDELLGVDALIGTGEV